MRFLLLALALLALALLAPVATPVVFAQHSHAPKEIERASLSVGLGDVSHPVSTANADAQRFFMFMPYATVVLVRFQKWDEILKTTNPDRT